MQVADAGLCPPASRQLQVGDITDVTTVPCRQVSQSPCRCVRRYHTEYVFEEAKIYFDSTEQAMRSLVGHVAWLSRSRLGLHIGSPRQCPILVCWHP